MEKHNEIVIILAMEGCLKLLSHVNDGKGTGAGRILAGNSKVCEMLDTSIEKERGTTIEFGMSFFSLATKNISLMPLGIGNIYLRVFQK